MGNLQKVMSAAVIGAFLVLGCMVGMRMDQNTMALLGGTVIGMLIATPCAAIATYVSMRGQFQGAGMPAPTRVRMPAQPPVWFPPASAPVPTWPTLAPRRGIDVVQIGKIRTDRATTFAPGYEYSADSPLPEIEPAREWYFVGLDGQPQRLNPDDQMAQRMESWAIGVEAVFAAYGFVARVHGGKAQMPVWELYLTQNTAWNTAKQLEVQIGQQLGEAVRVSQAGAYTAIVVMPRN